MYIPNACGHLSVGSPSRSFYKTTKVDATSIPAFPFTGSVVSLLIYISLSPAQAASGRLFSSSFSFGKLHLHRRDLSVVSCFLHEAGGPFLSSLLNDNTFWTFSSVQHGCLPLQASKRPALVSANGVALGAWIMVRYQPRRTETTAFSWGLYGGHGDWVIGGRSASSPRVLVDGGGGMDGLRRATHGCK